MIFKSGIFSITKIMPLLLIHVDFENVAVKNLSKVNSKQH